MIDTSLAKGDFPRRSGAAAAIASELKRIDVNCGAAHLRIDQWNNENRSPLKLRDVERAVDNAFANEYNYGCENPILKAFCIGPETCPFSSRVRAKPHRHNDLKFIDLGWPQHLSPLPILLYAVAIPYLEKTRQIGIGGVVFANHHQSAEARGASKRWVGRSLSALSATGLIEYEPGTPRKRERKASRIRRILPVPHPTAAIVNILEHSNSSVEEDISCSPVEPESQV